MKDKSFSTNKVRKSLLYWCCKPLGLKTFEYLLGRSDYGQTFVVSGVATSSKDRYESKIKELAIKNGINVFSDEDIVAGEYDIGFCIGYPKKINTKTLNLCKEGVINLHFAPLPTYRGSGTLTHAIINEEKEYGVTLHLMDEKLDTGPIILVQTIPLSKEKTAWEIIKDIEALGFQVVVKNFTDLIMHTYELKDQSEIIKRSGVKPQFCTKKSVDDLYNLDFNWEFDKVHRYLRALTLGKPKKPYFEQLGKRICLSLSED